MRNRYLAVGLAGSLILGAAIPSRADNPGLDLPTGSKWRTTEGKSPEGSFSKADQIVLNQAATQGRLDQMCHNLQLGGTANVSLPSSDGTIPLEVLRRFVTLPSSDNPQNLELYQVDEYSPGVNLAPTFNVAQRTDAALGIGITAGFTMDSTVVRPRSYIRNCGEIKELLNLKDVKVVLPPGLLTHPSKDRFIEEMTARISAMEDGELWELSGVTTISAAPEIGAAVGHVSAGVSIGGTQNGGAVMIVHRLSRTHARFSLRVTHLHVFNAAGTVADIPVFNLLQVGGAVTLDNELAKVFDGVVGGQLAEYFTSSFSVLKQAGSQSTQQYLISFDVDPSDPAQAAELAEMMQSDFLTLLEKAASMATLHSTQNATLENFGRLTEKHASVFDKMAAVVQTDIGLIDQNHSVTLKLPVLGSHTRASDSSRDDVVTVGPNSNGTESRELHLASAERPKTDLGLSIPIVDQTLVSDTSLSKYTGFYFADNGRLQVVFAHMDSFQRRKAGAVQDMLNEYRDILSMIGSRGDPGADADAGQYQITLPEKRGKTYKSGTVAFTMDIAPDGVDKAFHASVDEIRKAALRVFPGDDALAAKIASALVRARDGTPAQRNAALRNLIVRGNDSGVVAESLRTIVSFLPVQQVRQILDSSTDPDIAYSSMLKVLVQLADPQDVSANLALKIDKGVKRQKKTTADISVNQGASNPDLADAGAANRERTLPAPYMDINQ